MTIATCNAASEFVDRHPAEGRAGRIAFVDGSGTLTYGELAEQCGRMANLLAASAIPRESRIALLLHDTRDFPVAFWGAIKAGVVPVALNTLLTTEQYAYVLADSRAKALVVSAALLPVVEPILGALPFLTHVFVSGGSAPPFARDLASELRAHSPAAEAAPTSRRASATSTPA
jgi:acyl-CoA synthetase (AMP-forming)/AMP-acid ligase II